MKSPLADAAGFKLESISERVCEGVPSPGL